MKTFSEFLTESQWMYHGSPAHDLTHLKANRSEYMLDRAVGAHFAADPTVSTNFATWKQGRVGGQGYAGDHQDGALYRTRAPKRSELFVVKQRKYSHGGRESDQNAIGAFISSTVFEHEPELFKQWAMRARNIDEPTAHLLWDTLKAGRKPLGAHFGGAESKWDRSLFSYMRNFDSGLTMMSSVPGFKENVVNKFVETMKKKGYKGLVYHNTGPMETFGARSRKSYIVFEPENHPLEKLPTPKRPER